MVGLRLENGSAASAGAPLLGSQDGIFPMAAALSSLYLPHHCSACFAPCTRSSPLLTCQGPCHGAVVYCSPFCRNLDLDLHCNSGECFLLTVCGPPAATSLGNVWPGHTSFRSLGGTCDLRTAMRLLAHYEAQHDTSRFLASRKKDNNCRLGSLISNRSALLQPVSLMQIASLGPGEVSSASEIDDDAQNLATELREAARLICFARHSRAPLEIWGSREPMTREDEISLAEEVICQVFTNGVQIQLDKLEQPDSISAERGPFLVTDDLGTAVYGPLFSWLNHSCRPNAFYRFDYGDPRIHENSSSHEFEVTVVPDTNTPDVVEAWNLEIWRNSLSRMAPSVTEQASQKGSVIASVEKRYGPRVAVRSITSVGLSEAVNITYIDLLQSKCTRKVELWRKYRFDCSCERCSESPTALADEVLQKIGPCHCGAEMSSLEEALRSETEQGITEFMGSGNTWSCCRILENALVKFLLGIQQDCLSQKEMQVRPYKCNICKRKRGIFDGEDDNLSTEFVSDWTRIQCSVQNINCATVHVMHHMCLNMYTTLSSSYSIAAVESKSLVGRGGADMNHTILSRESELQNNTSGYCGSTAGVTWSAASAGFTLLLASAVQYMFESGEPGLIALAARLWFHTGEAFIRLISTLDSHFSLGPTKPSFELTAVCSRKGGSGHVKEGNSLKGENEIRHPRRKAIGLDQPCNSKETLDFDKSLMHILASVWPLLNESSPFLSYIESPLDPNTICYNKLVAMPGKLCSAVLWRQSRLSFLSCSCLCLQYSEYLSKVCCGHTDPLVMAAQISLHWIMSNYH